jgi:hypothetical protein
MKIVQDAVLAALLAVVAQCGIKVLSPKSLS